MLEPEPHEAEAGPKNPGGVKITIGAKTFKNVSLRVVWNFESLHRVRSLTAAYAVRVLCTRKKGHLRMQCSNASADIHDNFAGKYIECGLLAPG